jgi:hypothetical protein
MRKLIVLFAVTFISLNALCQKLDNPFYFRFGFSNPSWEYFDQGKDYWQEDVSKYGVNFELGTIFLIPSSTMSENMVFGINVDYFYANFNNFHGEDDSGEASTGIYRVGSKVGPSFTYIPAEKMALDVYVKADVAWAAVVAPYEKEIDDGDDYFIDYLPVGFSTGLNFRYGMLMLGVEFNTISPKLESDDHKGVYLQEILDEFNGEDRLRKKTKMPNMNFTIGMSF